MSRVAFQVTRTLAPLSKHGVFCAPKGATYSCTATFRPEKGYEYGTVKILEGTKTTASTAPTAAPTAPTMRGTFN